MKKIITWAAVLGFVPAIASAQITDVDALIQWISGFINAVMPLIIAIAVLYFLWGLVKYVLSAGDADARTEARNMMVWGVIIIFVMVSVWGLVNILVNTFGTAGAVAPPAPVNPPVPTIT